MLRKGERMRGAAMEEEGWDKTKKVQSNDGHDPFRFFKPISLHVFALCGEPAILPGMPSGGDSSRSCLFLALQSTVRHHENVH